jgi:streptogramin lyase
MGTSEFDDDTDEAFERHVARLNDLQGQPLPEPSKPVAVVYGDDERRWFFSFAEAAKFAREAFEPGAYAIRNLSEPAPFVPMVTIKN